MKISIIICAYNSQEYLHRCIDSVLNQNLQDFELIIVDDNSTDDTLSIINKYALSDDRVRCLSTCVYNTNENVGPSKARNLGIEMALGTYISFMDADDFSEPDMLEKLWVHASTQESQIICCGYYMDMGRSSKKFLYKPFHSTTSYDFSAHLPLLLSNHLLNVVWNKIYLRRFILESGVRFPEHMHNGEDRYFNLMLLSKITSFTFHNEPLYHYIVRTTGITYGSFYEDRFVWGKEILSIQTALFTKLGILSEENKSMLQFLFIKVVLSCFCQLYFKTCSLNKREGSTYIKKIINDYSVVDAVANLSSTKLSHKIIIAAIRSRNILLCKTVAFVTTFSSKYLQPILMRLKY